MSTKSQNYFLIGSILLLSPLYVQTKHTPSDTVVATINAGINPAGMAITPNGRLAYVANNNNNGVTDENTVSVLDLRHNLPSQTISDPSFDGPYTVTINPSGTRAYVTNSNSTTISVIDLANNQVIAVIDGFDGPSGMVINPAGNRAYVNNYGSPAGVGSGNGTTVSMVDLNSNTIIGDPIEVGMAPAALAMSRNGTFVYVVNYVDGNPGTGSMSIIPTNSNVVSDTITGFFGPFDIALNGKFAYVTNFGSNNFSPVGSTVSVVDLPNRTIVGTIDVGLQPSGIALSPDGSLAYVTNYNTVYSGPDFTNLTAGQGTVNIIDTKSNEVIAPTIPVGQSPDEIVISPNGKYAYVSNYTSNTVDVIRL